MNHEQTDEVVADEKSQEVDSRDEVYDYIIIIIIIIIIHIEKSDK